MKYLYTYKVGQLENEEKEFYERVNPGFICTGATLIEKYREEQNRESGGQTLVVFKGKRTMYGMCRDCGDHYIIARWSRYDRIDKDTLKITFDVEDR